MKSPGALKSTNGKASSRNALPNSSASSLSHRKAPLPRSGQRNCASPDSLNTQVKEALAEALAHKRHKAATAMQAAWRGFYARLWGCDPRADEEQVQEARKYRTFVRGEARRMEPALKKKRERVAAAKAAAKAAEEYITTAPLRQQQAEAALQRAVATVVAMAGSRVVPRLNISPMRVATNSSAALGSGSRNEGVHVEKKDQVPKFSIGSTTNIRHVYGVKVAPDRIPGRPKAVPAVAWPDPPADGSPVPDSSNLLERERRRWAAHAAQQLAAPEKFLVRERRRVAAAASAPAAPAPTPLVGDHANLLEPERRRWAPAAVPTVLVPAAAAKTTAGADNLLERELRRMAVSVETTLKTAHGSSESIPFPFTVAVHAEEPSSVKVHPEVPVLQLRSKGSTPSSRKPRPPPPVRLRPPPNEPATRLDRLAQPRIAAAHGAVAKAAATVIARATSMAQLQVVPQPEIDPGVVVNPLPEPLPTWRRAQNLRLSRQNEDWTSAILPIGSMLRDALGIDEKEAHIAQERHERLKNLELPLFSMLEQLPSCKKHDLAHELAKAGISSMRALSRFASHVELAQAIGVADLSPQSKRVQGLGDALHSAILLARRALARAAIEQLVIAEDDARVSVVQKASDEARASLVAAMATQEADDRARTIAHEMRVRRREMLLLTKRNAAAAVELFSRHFRVVIDVVEHQEEDIKSKANEKTLKSLPGMPQQRTKDGKSTGDKSKKVGGEEKAKSKVAIMGTVDSNVFHELMKPIEAMELVRTQKELDVKDIDDLEVKIGGALVALGFSRSNSSKLEARDEAFLAWDASGDGNISKMEFREFVRKLPGCENHSIHNIDELFDKVDLDSSGSINAEELQPALAAWRHAWRKHSKENEPKVDERKEVQQKETAAAATANAPAPAPAPAPALAPAPAPAEGGSNMSDLLKKRSGNMNESFKKRKNARNSKPDSSAAESRGPLRGPFSDATLEDVEFVFAAFGSDQLQTNVFNDEDEKVRIVFKHFDKDGSGTLSVKELRNALKFYGFSATTRQTEKVLGAYDSTPDGKVDQAEFAKLIKEVSKHNLTFEASEFIGLLSQLVDPEAWTAELTELVNLQAKKEQHTEEMQKRKKKLSLKDAKPSAFLHFLNTYIVEADVNLDFAQESRVQSAKRSCDFLDAELQSIRMQPGPVRRMLFALTNRWHDYMAFQLDLGARLADERGPYGSSAPSWQETFDWGRWMLSTRFDDAEITGDQVKRYLKLAQAYAWRAIFPSLKEMPLGEWRIYWARITRTFAHSFSEQGRRNLEELAATDARTSLIRDGRKMTSAREHAAVAGAVTVVSSILSDASRRARMPTSCRNPVQGDRSELRRLGLVDYVVPADSLKSILVEPIASVAFVPASDPPSPLAHPPKSTKASGRWKKAAAHVVAAEATLKGLAEEATLKAFAALALVKKPSPSRSPKSSPTSREDSPPKTGSRQSSPGRPNSRQPSPDRAASPSQRSERSVAQSTIVAKEAFMRPASLLKVPSAVVGKHEVPSGGIAGGIATAPPPSPSAEGPPVPSCINAAASPNGPPNSLGTAGGGMQIKGGKALAEKSRVPAETPLKYPEESDSDSERGCTLVISVVTDPGI